MSDEKKIAAPLQFLSGCSARPSLWSGSRAAQSFRGCGKRAARNGVRVCFDALRPVLYATPPDSNVVIDVYPDNDRTIIASPCLGPGFKHSAPIGEALAEQIIDSTSKVDISSFSLKSFRDLIQ
jgi:glycine/D-amino acid oxidase-like deaminating enzyme